MKNNLPKKLREMAHHLWDVEYRINIDDDTETLKAAADEIERLRAENDTLQSAAKQACIKLDELRRSLEGRIEQVLSDRKDQQ